MPANRVMMYQSKPKLGVYGNASYSIMLIDFFDFFEGPCFSKWTRSCKNAWKKAGQNQQQAWRLRCTLEERTSCQKNIILLIPQRRTTKWCIWTPWIFIPSALNHAYTIYIIYSLDFSHFCPPIVSFPYQVIWIWWKWFPVHSAGGFIWNRARITWSQEISREMRLNGWILTKGLILLRKSISKFSIWDVKNALSVHFNVYNWSISFHCSFVGGNCFQKLPGPSSFKEIMKQPLSYRCSHFPLKSRGKWEDW